MGIRMIMVFPPALGGLRFRRNAFDLPQRVSSSRVFLLERFRHTTNIADLVNKLPEFSNSSTGSNSSTSVSDSNGRLSAIAGRGLLNLR